MASAEWLAQRTLTVIPNLIGNPQGCLNAEVSYSKVLGQTLRGAQGDTEVASCHITVNLPQQPLVVL